MFLVVSANAVESLETNNYQKMVYIMHSHFEGGSLCPLSLLREMPPGTLGEWGRIGTEQQSQKERSQAARFAGALQTVGQDTGELNGSRSACLGPADKGTLRFRSCQPINITDVGAAVVRCGPGSRKVAAHDRGGGEWGLLGDTLIWHQLLRPWWCGDEKHARGRDCKGLSVEDQQADLEGRCVQASSGQRAAVRE